MSAKRGRQPLTIYVSSSELERIEASGQSVGLDVPGYVLQCARIMSRRSETRPYTPAELAIIVRERTAWSEAQLRDRGLPLYWSEA